MWDKLRQSPRIFSNTSSSFIQLWNKHVQREVVSAGRNVRERCYHLTHLFRRKSQRRRTFRNSQLYHYSTSARESGDIFNRLLWAQDGAPAHRRIIVCDRLNEVFNNRVIALGHETGWPHRYPDLTPCDFFLWCRSHLLAISMIRGME